MITINGFDGNDVLYDNQGNKVATMTFFPSGGNGVTGKVSRFEVSSAKKSVLNVAVFLLGFIMLMK